jgi:hypothetical protein
MRRARFFADGQNCLSKAFIRRFQGKDMRKKKWEFYGGSTPEDGFRRQSLEKDLLMLWTLDTRLPDDILLIFEEAVTDSLAEELGISGARAMATRIGASTFESPRKVSEVLDSVFEDGSEVLKRDIAERFRLGIHLLTVKMMKSYTRDPATLETSVRGPTGSAKRPRSRAPEYPECPNVPLPSPRRDGGFGGTDTQ